MYKVNVYDALGLAYSEIFETLQAAQEDFNSQLDYIDSEKCYDPELKVLSFIVQLCCNGEILESVLA